MTVTPPFLFALLQNLIMAAIYNSRVITVLVLLPRLASMIMLLSTFVDSLAFFWMTGSVITLHGLVWTVIGNDMIHNQLLRWLRSHYLLLCFFSAGSTPPSPSWALASNFQFHDHFTDGRTPWTSDQPVARPLPKHRTTQTQNKHIHKQNIQYLVQDLNPRSRLPSKRRQFMS
jgi:hypothetical protein